MANLFDNLITYVRIDTTALPTVVIDKPLAPGAPTDASLVKTLRPRVEIGIQGADPIVIQKWGDPRPTKWPTYATIAGVSGGIFLALAVAGVVSLARPKRSGAVSGLVSLHRQRRRR